MCHIQYVDNIVLRSETMETQNNTLSMFIFVFFYVYMFVCFC